MGGAASFAAGCIFYWQLPRLRLDAEKLLVDQGMASPLP
jgi:hypothetical protein